MFESINDRPSLVTSFSKFQSIRSFPVEHYGSVFVSAVVTEVKSPVVSLSEEKRERDGQSCTIRGCDLLVVLNPADPATLAPVLDSEFKDSSDIYTAADN